MDDNKGGRADKRHSEADVDDAGPDPSCRGVAGHEPLDRIEVRVDAVTVETASEAERLLTRFFIEEAFPLPPEGLGARIARYLALPHHAVFVAHAGSDAIGVASVTANYGLEYAWAAELEDLYVIPEHRGAGVARLLVGSAREWARGESCTSLLVTVTPEGQDAHDLEGLYRHLGFADRGRKLLELALQEQPAQERVPGDADL